MAQCWLWRRRKPWLNLVAVSQYGRLPSTRRSDRDSYVRVDNDNRGLLRGLI